MVLPNLSTKPVATLCLILVFGLGAFPGIAAAHAYPTREYPKAKSVLTEAPTKIAISFDDPVEASFARLQVLNDMNTDFVAAAPRVESDRLTLSAPLKRLSPGSYRVIWSVLAEDGHRTKGSYTFKIAGTN